MKFLANTGFLFPDLPFPERIKAAAAAGFDGVEFHDEIQRHDAAAIADLLAETGLIVGGLNIHMGATAGCAAIVGSAEKFAADMAAAHAAAEAVGARAIHVLAGRGATDPQEYTANLRRALDLTDRPILIEPISRAAMPDYHLYRLQDALDVVAAIADPRLAIMFDWYHSVAELGDIAAAKALDQHRASIGHVQAASFPHRNEPDPAMVDQARALGFTTIGLEYRPTMSEKVALSQIKGTYAT